MILKCISLRLFVFAKERCWFRDRVILPQLILTKKQAAINKMTQPDIY